MFKLSASSEYALLLVQYLKANPGFHTIASISSATNIPQTLLRKISGKLEHSGIILSKKGRYGGISLGKNTLSVHEVLASNGEDFSVVVCGEKCGNSSLCQLSPVLKNLQRGFESILHLTKI